MRKAFGHTSPIACFAAADLAGSAPATDLFGEIDPVELTRWTGDGGPSYEDNNMSQLAQQQQGHASGQQKELDLGDTFNFDGPIVQGDEGPTHPGHDYLRDELDALDH